MMGKHLAVSFSNISALLMLWIAPPQSMLCIMDTNFPSNTQCVINTVSLFWKISQSNTCYKFMYYVQIKPYRPPSSSCMQCLSLCLFCGWPHLIFYQIHKIKLYLDAEEVNILTAWVLKVKVAYIYKCRDKISHKCLNYGNWINTIMLNFYLQFIIYLHGLVLMYRVNRPSWKYETLTDTDHMCTYLMEAL